MALAKMEADALRIVHLSTFRPIAGVIRTEEYVGSALEDLGHEVIRVQVPPFWRRKRIARFKPDVILVHHSLDMPRRWIEGLKFENPRALVAQWIFDHLRDHEYESNWFLPRARQWDVSFLKDRERFSYYRSQGLRVHWLHQGAPSQSPFCEAPDPAHSCDVAFFGSPHHPYRVHVLRRIAEAGFKVHIYTHSSYRARWRREGLLHVFPHIHDAHMAPVCASAKFVLGVGCYPDEWQGYWSNRPYMTLATGGLFLSQYVRGMEEHFDNRKHLLWWRDVDECLDLIREFSGLPTERARIRRAGYEHVHEYHGYSTRCAEFIQVCEEELERLRGRDGAKVGMGEQR